MRKTDTRLAVLRGVYEDNAGIPRSYRGTGRPGDDAAATGRHTTGHRSRWALVVVLGLVALFGINFRLVTVDGTGPVAMQVVDKPAPKDPSVPDNAPIQFERPFTLEAGRQSDAAPIRAIADAAATTGQYDAMLAGLGMPMADLFNLKVHTIVIDPGHGGIDPGATGHQGLKEKDVALDIGRRLRDKLVASGSYRVLLTREEDKKVYLKERVAFAKENRADLFISIHINSLPAGAESLNYLETYYFGPHTDQRSLELAEKENRDSAYVMGDFREVIARIGDALKTQESRELADSIHERLYSSMKRRNPDFVDAGSKTGPFMVLLGVEVPSVLVEVSCISNKAEETRLSRPEYRDSVAGSLQAGIVEYLDRRAHRRTIEGGKTQYVAKQER
ncbi:MAG: N-acetylmuramoyl-L-alanine amidase [Gammaproteobacteria bacterium]